MIQGEFNSRGELFFEVGLLSADGEIMGASHLCNP
jgi:hypothetical protein